MALGDHAYGIIPVMKKSLIGISASILIALTTSCSVFAKIADCVGEGSLYSNLSTEQTEKFIIKCPTTITEDGQTYYFYARTAGDCATAGTLATNPDVCLEFEAAKEATEDKKNDGFSVLDIILVSGLCVSITLNIVLIILLATKKNVIVVEKTTPTVQEPSNNIYPTPNSKD